MFFEFLKIVEGGEDGGLCFCRNLTHWKPFGSKNLIKPQEIVMNGLKLQNDSKFIVKNNTDDKPQSGE